MHGHDREYESEPEDYTVSKERFCAWKAHKLKIAKSQRTGNIIKRVFTFDPEISAALMKGNARLHHDPQNPI